MEIPRCAQWDERRAISNKLVSPLSSCLDFFWMFFFFYSILFYWGYVGTFKIIMTRKPIGTDGHFLPNTSHYLKTNYRVTQDTITIAWISFIDLLLHGLHRFAQKYEWLIASISVSWRFFTTGQELPHCFCLYKYFLKVFWLRMEVSREEKIWLNGKW